MKCPTRGPGGCSLGLLGPSVPTIANRDACSLETLLHSCSDNSTPVKGKEGTACGSGGGWVIESAWL